MRLADSQRAALLAPEAGGPRAKHTAILLADGTIALIGGQTIR